MKACVIATTSRVGVGVQTVTGVVDHSGAPFVGKLAFAINLQSAFSTLAYQTAPNITAYVWNQGAGDASNGAMSALGDIDQFFAKIACTGDGRRYFLGDYQPDIFFGGNWQGFGYVSAFRSGEVDITFTFNNRGGWGFMLVVLGGDDLIIDVSAGMLSGVYPTSGTPVGVLVQSAAYAFGSAFTATTGAGGRQLTWGWDTKVNGRAMAGSVILSQSGNSRGARTDRMWSTINGAAFSGAPYVSSWDAGSYTIADGYSSACNHFAFSGVAAFAGAVNLRTTPGAQEIDLQIAARWVKIVTVGLVESPAADTSQAQLAVGWTDGTRQACAWAGETSAGALPVTGTRYLSQDAIVRISAAGAARSTTVFSAVASVDSLDLSTGKLTLDVSAADGVPYQLLIFALGDALPPPEGVLLTQMPLLAAYDYGTLAPLIKSGGLAWSTPPPPKRIT